MSIGFKLTKPFLHMLPAETAHNLTIWALKNGFGPRQKLNKHANMRITMWGQNFTNPIGLAAGFDKNAETMRGCFRMGFGFVEVGTVTVSAQKGNLKPRIHRFPKHCSVINHLGFPNNGLTAFKRKILQFKKYQKPDQILGVNIVKDTKSESLTDDYVRLVEELGGFADFIGVNISCPNVPEFTNMQDPDLINELIKNIFDAREYSVKAANKPPVLVKLSPDLSMSELERIANLLMTLKVDGVILTNTTKSRADDLSEEMKWQKGGLSGASLTDKSTKMISEFYQMTDGKVPIIGVGGICSAEDAWQKIIHGASLVQVYSGLVFKGPALLKEIYEGVSERLEQHNFYALKDAVGSVHKKKVQQKTA